MEGIAVADEPARRAAGVALVLGNEGAGIGTDARLHLR
jgi:tRNA G18 (ribose-2'-O)-methylase SpoU